MHPDASHRAEYERLQAGFPGGLRRIEMEDPDASWAVPPRPASEVDATSLTGLEGVGGGHERCILCGAIENLSQEPAVYLGSAFLAFLSGPL
jgi:hypothetical protein